METNGEWQLVQRRRRYPDGWKTQEVIDHGKARPYIPYYAKKTFAQAVTDNRPTHIPSQETHYTTTRSRPSPPPSRPSSSPPKTLPTYRYYSSPTSLTSLRFPPASSFPEWKERCFRCFRFGHNATRCCNPVRCCRCWTEGHTINQCKSTLNPSARPFSLNNPKPQQVPPANSSVAVQVQNWVNNQEPQAPPLKLSKNSEPSFDELLRGNAPVARPMPDDRPFATKVFLDRDDYFYEEIEKLSRAVIIHGGVEVSQAIAATMDTGLVREEEIRVAQLARKRILIHLPVGLKVDTFIRAMPAALWEKGYSFQPWSQLEGAKINIPCFKVLIDLIDLPVHLTKEREVIKAVSSFGIFLGTVAPEHKCNLAFWRVAVATDYLRRVPKALEMISGGIEYPVEVKTVIWEVGPIYAAADFPSEPPIYSLRRHHHHHKGRFCNHLAV